MMLEKCRTSLYKAETRGIPFSNIREELELEDLRTQFVCDARTRDRFLYNKKYLHFNENTHAMSQWSSTFNFEPLTKSFCTNFKQFGNFSENLSTDEQIRRYYGRNCLKQFLRAKTIRFVFKKVLLAPKVFANTSTCTLENTLHAKDLLGKV